MEKGRGENLNKINLFSKRESKKSPLDLAIRELLVHNTSASSEIIKSGDRLQQAE